MNNNPDRPPRTGRPKSDEKRQAILGAAAELFLHSGFKDTSMDALAAAAGVSKQTVYSHFDTKDTLLRACLQDKLHQHGLNAEDMPKDKPLDEALRHIGGQFVDLINDEEVIGTYRLMISECVAQPSLAHTFFEAGPNVTRDAVSGFLQAHDVPAGRFGDGRHAAGVFFALLEHVHMKERLLNLRGPMDPDQRREHVNRVVDQFLTLYP
ncbi:MAG: TetR/AcrR family transcriptional regulator [Gammaproteobacteria bacterium]